MENTEIFKRLKDRFGSHSEAARFVGITPRHYRRIRQGGYKHKGAAPIIMLLERIARASRPRSSGRG